MTRGRIPQATAPLSDARVRLEQMAIDFRGYRLPGGVNPCTGGGTPPHLTWIAQFSNADFTVTCTSTANAYLVTATGVGRMAGFVYTVNQANVRASTVTGLNGWTGNASCWVVKKGGHCG
ncbi:MAG: hypothetical protein FWC38_04475 [Proteobacteria bacterium]|nr:hypothetical protein [Pseudomonadota bacterium]MCL2307478.1 hypothetical protein [Pseudomonadota bacterium]